ncbi:MAG: hypothetical protein FWG68_09030 [Defluviitaleaceae bacterium]|nr:hypothetical protein [Defluviitaleaceae bacterium]
MIDWITMLINFAIIVAVWFLFVSGIDKYDRKDVIITDKSAVKRIIGGGCVAIMAIYFVITLIFYFGQFNPAYFVFAYMAGMFIGILFMNVALRKGKYIVKISQATQKK